MRFCWTLTAHHTGTQTALRYNGNTTLRGTLMAQINSFQDLLDLLDKNPEYVQELRARLLTEDLVALPEKFAQLVSRFDQFVAATDRRFESLESDVKVLKEDVAVLKEDVAVLKEDVAVLKEDVAVLKEDVTVLKEDVKVLKDDVGALKGSDIERRVRDNILNIAKDTLGLTRGRVLLQGSGDIDSQLRAAIEQAEARGVVTEEDVDNLLVADIVIRARRAADRRSVYAVFEVSSTINNRDIDRAQARASSVAAITGDEALAVVLGGVIRPRQQQRAAEQGVAVVIPAMFGTERSGEEDD